MYVAHFLDNPELIHSPPNEALISAFNELGYSVDIYAPGITSSYEITNAQVSLLNVFYSYRWIIKNMGKTSLWSKYQLFSSTAEDPMALAGMLSMLYRKPSIALVDEIKSELYSGNRSKSWKYLCKWAMKRSICKIVNDNSRIELLREYLNLKAEESILVYPGCFRNKIDSSMAQAQHIKNKWQVPEGNINLCFSGTFYEHNGVRLVLSAFLSREDINLIIYPVNLDEISRYLLMNLKNADRIYIQEYRLSFHEAWKHAAAVDIGVAIYLHKGPQFQHMGTSSNRLCMFLAMGVPVIVSKQSSFEFVERYDCGVMVENETEFIDAIDYIKSRLEKMKKNALRCAFQYINAENAYKNLLKNFKARLDL